MKYKLRMRTFHVLHEPGIDMGLITGPEDAVPLLKAIFRDACDADKEHFVVLALDARGRAVGYKIVAIGTLTSCIISPRSVMAAAIHLQAAAILIAHSHPSQDPTPSQEDLALTQRMIQAGEILGIPVIDHLIVASAAATDSRWVSIGDCADSASASHARVETVRR